MGPGSPSQRIFNRPRVIRWSLKKLCVCFAYEKKLHQYCTLNMAQLSSMTKVNYCLWPTEEWAVIMLIEALSKKRQNCEFWSWESSTIFKNFMAIICSTLVVWCVLGIWLGNKLVILSYFACCLFHYLIMPWFFILVSYCFHVEFTTMTREVHYHGPGYLYIVQAE